MYSPHAHARIRSVDKAAAEQTPGIYAVLTGKEWAADGLGTLDPEFMAEDVGGPTGVRTKVPPDRVLYVGEQVAVVIAATEQLAHDAVESAFARAHHVTGLSLYNNRVTAVTMEPRGCIAEYDPGTGATRSIPAHRTCMASVKHWRVRS